MVPGAQTPVHAPLTQASVHAVARPQRPLLLQVSTALPEHWVAAGAHTPVHAPFTQAELVHAVAVAHWPFEPQACTPLPEHRR